MAPRPKVTTQAPPEPVRMPDPESDGIAAKRRAQNALLAQRGRASTDLTTGDGTSLLGK